MALIKCPECGKEMSNLAQTCPNCGNPIHPVVIEQTSKRWKKAKLISWIVFLVGLYMFIYNFQHGNFNNPYTGLGFCLAFFSFIAIIIAKFGAWWNHK